MTTFVVYAEVKCDTCNGKGCEYCRFRGFNREPVEFTIDEEGKVLKVEVV